MRQCHIALLAMPPIDYMSVLFDKEISAGITACKENSADIRTTNFIGHLYLLLSLDIKIIDDMPPTLCLLAITPKRYCATQNIISGQK